MAKSSGHFSKGTGHLGGLRHLLRVEGEVDIPGAVPRQAVPVAEAQVVRLGVRESELRWDVPDRSRSAGRSFSRIL